MYANLCKTIKEFDVSYRKGRATISDQEFDSLVRNLKRIDPNNSYFHQNKVLPSMGNGNYEEFLETLLQDTRLILTPKKGSFRKVLFFLVNILKLNFLKRFFL